MYKIIRILFYLEREVEQLIKKCKNCDKEFVDNTSNKNKECCSKYCTNVAWYLRKKNKKHSDIRKKRQLSDYNNIATKNNAVLLDYFIYNSAMRLKFQCIFCGNIWESHIHNILRGHGQCVCLQKNNAIDLEGAIKTATQKNYTLNKKSFINGSKKAKWHCNACGYDRYVSHTSIKRSNCPGCRKGIENHVRAIFEKKLGKKFISVRPLWLINPDSNYRLQLDGYCEELKLAFEYDGEFHYIRYWGANTNSNLLKTQQRDKIKDELCKKRSITLIRIPYWEKKNLESFIDIKLKEAGII